MTAPPPDIAARFALLIAGLCRVVAAHIADDREAGPWIIRVWNRLQSIGRRLERLAAQVSAGTVPKPRASFSRPKPRKPAVRPPIVLAGRPAWLIHAVQKTAVYGEHLRQLLADPEMAALLAAAPQLARVLRPLCRALGVEPPPLPPRPTRPPPDPPRPAPPDAPPAEATPAMAASQAVRPDPEAPPAPARASALPVTTVPRFKLA